MSMSSSNAAPESKPVHAVLSLGANTGAREHTILEAVHRLIHVRGVSVRRMSSLYESEPVGDGLTGTFINAAAAIETTLSPEELLDVCLALETRAGRKRDTGLRDRPLDADILLYGAVVYSAAGIEIPHPRLAERRFVLVPLAEIGGSIAVPPDGASIDELLGTCPGREWVRLVSSRRRIY
jgi:2-amino-4-hydroxy-6-hydroxymethyldihydropteridine diphosphokinase